MELAQLYCPDVQPKTAWRKLKEWIDYYPHLNEKLALLGRTTCTRTYSPPQVRAIVEALGEPKEPTPALPKGGSLEEGGRSKEEGEMLRVSMAPWRVISLVRWSYKADKWAL